MTVGGDKPPGEDVIGTYNIHGESFGLMWESNTWREERLLTLVFPGGERVNKSGCWAMLKNDRVSR